MKDDYKTKGQLVNELVKLRQRIAGLEAPKTDDIRPEETARTMLDNVVIGISMISPKMEIIWLNKTFKEWFPQLDVNKKPLCYKSFYSPPKDGICDYCPTVKVFKTGEMHSSETGVCADGKIYNVIASPVKDNKGKTEYVIETVEDITERKRADEALKAAILRAEDERARSEAIIAGMGDGISIQDTDFKILYQNQVHKDIIGDHVGEYCYWAYERNENVCEGCPVAMSFKDGKIHTEERRVDLDDRMLYVEITASPLRDAAGKIIRGIEVVRDITERKEAEEKLRKSEEKYRSLADTLSEVVYRADPETFQTTYINSAIKSVSGYSAEEWLSDTSLWENTVYPDDRKRVFAILAEAQGKLKNFSIEYRLVRKDRSVRWVEDRVALEKDQYGKVVSINGVMYDITEQKKMENELKQLATMDSLTQVFNRTKFDEIMAREMARAKRFDKPLSIIIYDMDSFKKINDGYGHIVGDRVLKTSADLVRGLIRKIDYIVRWGGEEFVIIAPETDLKNAEELAERIRKSTESHRFDKVERVTVSFGVTEFKKDDDVDSILKRADDALYKAKSRGRNRVVASG
jgi:diguanylate cyclase (GGDEF)-like protein/PAS domain S-box-containing protein